MKRITSYILALSIILSIFTLSVSAAQGTVKFEIDANISDFYLNEGGEARVKYTIYVTAPNEGHLGSFQFELVVPDGVSLDMNQVATSSTTTGYYINENADYHEISNPSGTYEDLSYTPSSNRFIAYGTTNERNQEAGSKLEVMQIWGTVSLDKVAEYTLGMVENNAESMAAGQWSGYAEDNYSNFEVITSTIKVDVAAASTPQAQFVITSENTATLTAVNTQMEYSVDAGVSWLPVTNTTQNITEVTDLGIWIRDKGNGSTTGVSAIQKITITKQALPTGVVAQEPNSIDETVSILGITTDMEYKLATESEYQSGTGNPITGVNQNAIYHVRNKHTANSLSSDYITITIPQYGKSTVIGQVTSYNPIIETTITLVAVESDETYTTVIAKESNGSGKHTQSYTIMNVSEGTYNLVVSKEGHLNHTIKDVVVGSNDLDLTTNINTHTNNHTLISGDVGGDGQVNFDDLNIVVNSKNYNKLTTSAGVSISADINGDGQINFDDLNIVVNSKNYNKTVVNSTYSYED